MEFHGNFSKDFYGTYLHGGLGHFPWNSMENIRTPFSMEFHGKVPCNSIETTHRLFHGSRGSLMELSGITQIKYPVNQMAYITDFGPLQFI